ncbi:MAG: transporter substrate-binding domain-containing protein [Alphaproteobacteria bacterium]|nr:transporter substrate-binding domain-containing protein [Alphaproteobacteria bacterium]
MTNKILLVALLVALTLLAYMGFHPTETSGSHKETAFERVMRTGTIRCGYGIWIPEMVKDANTGALSGVDYDIMNAVGHALGLKVEWTEEVGWPVAQQGLASGRYDVFCNGAWPTPSRTKTAFYSRPFMYSPVYAAISAKKNVSTQDISWANKPETTIAVLPNTAIDTFANSRFPNAKKFDLSDLSNDGDLMLAIATGKADMGLSTYSSIKKYMDANPGQIHINDQPVIYAPGSFLLPHDDYRLKHMVDFTITYLLEMGVIRNILMKDLPDSQHDWRYPAVEHEP